MTKIELLQKYLLLAWDEIEHLKGLPHRAEGGFADRFQKEFSKQNARPAKEKLPPISFDSTARKWNNIPDNLRELWKTACPAVDVEVELAKAAAWMLTNPLRAPKANYGRFLNGWMTRSQQRGGSRPLGQSPRNDEEAQAWASRS